LKTKLFTPFKQFLWALVLILGLISVGFIRPMWYAYPTKQLYAFLNKPFADTSIDMTNFNMLLDTLTVNDSLSIKDTILKNTLDTLFVDSLTIDTLKITDTTFINGLDTTQSIRKKKRVDSANYKKARQNKFVLPLEFTEEGKALLYQFFSSLDGKASNELVRILHYGDSQIEGDRITSHLRNMMQKKFGGCGIGLIPLKEMRDYNISVQLKVSNNWERYSIRDSKNHELPDRHYGILLEYSKFNSSINIGGNSNAWIELRRQNISYPLSRTFQTFNVFYGFNNQPFITFMEYGGTALEAEMIEPNQALDMLTWNFEDPPTNFRLHFQGDASPTIFGISMDGRSGVAVDNLSLRGSSGLEFTKDNAQFYKSMYNKLNVQLVLLQFGANVVPNESNNYKYYEAKLQKQLAYFRQIHPNVPVIIMGVSDMAHKVNGEMTSYENIEKIRDAQRRVAFRNNCVFWDLYLAMGGKNSMISWVNNNPPLANKDYIHFSHSGGKLIAEIFFRSLMVEYENYKLLGE